MNTTLLGLALLGAAFGVSSSNDDEFWHEGQAARREADRKARRDEDKVRAEARRAGHKYQSARPDHARILREREGGRPQRGDREQLDVASRIAADNRISNDIEKLRKAINRGKKTTARRAAEQLRITLVDATKGPKSRLAKRVLKIAKERGMA